MEETILAYAAGLIDGEGSITIGCVKPSGAYARRRHPLHFQLGMTDETTIQWFAHAFSLKVYTRQQGRRKVCYTIQLFSHKAAEVLRLVRPFLIAKAAHADLAIEYEKSLAEFEKVNRRRPLRDEELARRHLFYEKMKALNGYQQITNPLF